MSNELLQQILNELKTIKTDIKDLKEGQERIEQKLNATHDQVFRNIEGIESIKGDVKEIKQEIGILEAVTKENTFDITKLKLIK